MRIFAKVTGGDSGKEETLVVACTDTSRPVSSIVDELKAREEVSGVGERYQLRLAENGAILNDKSRIEDVLKDDDVVLVGALIDPVALYSTYCHLSSSAPGSYQWRKGRLSSNQQVSI